ncbi:MAG: threonyl-tRNA synthetase [Selenomonas sp.]|nr:threonyl-tRNA synthetase [Selenomonas sp.]
MQLLDTPEFPAVFYALAKAQTEELAALRARKDAKWVFVSPAADFRPDGEKTGAYILGGEELTLSAAGESIISYADYAVGMVDLIESGEHIGTRVSLVQK